MNLKALVDEVLAMTKRPDKAAAAVRAINKACQRIAIQHKLRPDHNEVPWIVDPVGATEFNIPLSVMPSFRAIDYIKPADRDIFLTKINPKELFCSSTPKTDVYYITGADVIVRLKVASASLILAWYRYPAVLSQNTDENWCTVTYPYTVLDGAAAIIFNEIGDDTSYRLHEEEFRLACVSIVADLKHAEV